jgi:hypothetical protein
MSAVVNIWTTEVAKLEEKGQTLHSNGSSPTNHAESSHKVEPKEEAATGLLQAFSRFKRVNSPVVLYSEASISMLLECLSA